MMPDDRIWKCKSVGINPEKFRKTLSFYRDVLGFDVHVEGVAPNRHLRLSLGENEIYAGESDAAWSTLLEKDKKFECLVDDVVAMHAQIRDAGYQCQLLRRNPETGEKFFIVKDPLGFEFILSEEHADDLSATPDGASQAHA